MVNLVIDVHLSVRLDGKQMYHSGVQSAFGYGVDSLQQTRFQGSGTSLTSDNHPTSHAAA